ncbi:MAG: PH domain-containing protein [Pseudobdellovibrionaceae bacterium]
MLYVQQSLAPDEEIIHIGHFHWIYDLQAYFNIFWGFLTAILLIVGALYIQNRFNVSLSSYDLPPTAGFIDEFRALHPGIKLFSFLLFLLGVLRFAHMMVTKATTEICVTTSRLVYKRGLIARYVGEMSIDRIEGVNVLQGMLGRIFDYGRIMVRGMGVGEVVLPPLARPIVFRKAIEKARMS